MFMVAGVYFLRDFLFVLITRIFLSIRSNVVLAVCMCAAIAVLSAFLDALTILAILVTVGYGFYDAYSRVAVGRVANPDSEHDFHLVPEARREELEQFRAFLRSMLMHGAVGTAIGGVCTLVGEPENIIIGAAADWNFGRFFAEVAPVAVPVLIAGLITCAALERLKIFGYGIPLPPGVAAVLNRELQEQQAHWTMKDRMLVVAQAVICVGLIAGLGLHVAEVGLLGLALVVLASTMSGVTTEHQLGKAFEAGLPFTALIVVFFAIVGMIHTQHLFEPVIAWVLTLDGTSQLLMVYASNGLLSAISDNVFVAAIYIDQAKQAFTSGLITLERFEQLAVAIVMGTGIPAMATPNGQAAFLFLFTSAIGKLVGLSYGRMVWMALPYVIITSAAAALMFAFI
jgi:NhaB family Na+:H+ antiporter